MCPLFLIMFDLAAGQYALDSTDAGVELGAQLLQLRTEPSQEGGARRPEDLPPRIRADPSQAASAVSAAEGGKAVPGAGLTAGEALGKAAPAGPSNDPKPHRTRVLFGVQMTATPVYEAKLNASLGSWLRDVAPEDRIILGPRCEAEGARCEGRPWEASTCSDHSQLCKHAALLDRAYGKDFDWFVTLGEDHVVMADLLKASLAYLDPTVPAALASIGDTEEDGGCGQLWQYSKGSKNGTLPVPDGWVEPNDGQAPCPAVQKRGGLCGGTGIVYSSAALQRLFADGREAFWSRLAPLLAKQAQYDTAMSCELLDRGVHLNQGCGLMNSALSMHVKADHLDDPANFGDGLIYHVAGADDAPNGMRKVWNKMLAKKKDLLTNRRAWVSQCLNKCSINGLCRAPAVRSVFDV